MTYWTHHFEELEQETGLRNIRQGRGIYPSWPVHLPFAAIPIDHCLLSPEVQVHAFDTLPRLGSDHLGLVVELSLKQE